MVTQSKDEGVFMNFKHIYKLVFDPINVAPDPKCNILISYIQKKILIVIQLSLRTIVLHSIDISQSLRSMSSKHNDRIQKLGKIQNRLNSVFYHKNKIGSALIISRYTNILRDFKNVFLFQKGQGELVQIYDITNRCNAFKQKVLMELHQEYFKSI